MIVGKYVLLYADVVRFTDLDAKTNFELCV